MKVVITGGAGFLGARLARAILARGTLRDQSGEECPVTELVLVDTVEARGFDDRRARAVARDLCTPGAIAEVLGRDTDSIFHLAAVVSGQAEAEFDTGMRVNLDATRALLEQCRTLPRPPRLVFTSSLAVFGGALPAVVPDDQAVTPQTSYGTQKAMCELLIDDMTRRGMVDGRSLRLPTISVRPGKPNRAASSFASGIVREPLAGVDGVCPVAASTRMYLLSPRRAIESLLIGHDAPASRFLHRRSVNVPGLSVTVGEMVEALREVAGDAVAARVRWERDPVIDRMVSTWPGDMAPASGLALGMRADASFADAVRAYIEDDMPRG